LDFTFTFDLDFTFAFDSNSLFPSSLMQKAPY
jgi:hypothetical protein